jgi:hypothetical protein
LLLLSLSANAFQQDRGRFIVGVLLHQFAPEGFGEDRLAEAIGRASLRHYICGEDIRFLDGLSQFKGGESISIVLLVGT